MIRVQKKEEQFNTTIFNGRFVVNKPVASGFTDIVAPYSNLFYWSHAVAIDDCEFPLHPHKGFEIMTFVLNGNVTHFDTATKVWTPLETGDFQIIQSNKGIQHQERITKGTSSFQIWFDPNFDVALRQNASYMDYHSRDFTPVMEDGIETTYYIGGPGKVFALTPHLMIKKLSFANVRKTQLPLDEHSSYTLYVLSGQGSCGGQQIKTDDAIRISDTREIDIDFSGELFCIQTATQPGYTPVWIAV